MLTYTRADVQKYTGVPDSQFTWYADRGLVTPEGGVDGGRGGRRRFSAYNLLEFMLAYALDRRGFESSAIAVVLRQLWTLERAARSGRRLSGDAVEWAEARRAGRGGAPLVLVVMDTPALKKYATSSSIWRLDALEEAMRDWASSPVSVAYEKSQHGEEVVVLLDLRCLLARLELATGRTLASAIES